MSNDLRELTALCPPPAAPVRPRRAGAAVERTVPDSHRALVDAYGVGCFDEFLWIYGVGAENPHLDIAAATEVTRTILRGKPIPRIRAALAAHGLDTDDLVQWGGTDNGDVLLWVPVGAPDAWPTLIVEAGQLDFALVAESSTRVILGLLTGSLRVRCFPEDFPSERPEFAINPYA
ncbi:hypothetical protein E1265_02365 [Streptomyces sp. 8K308]|uniref:hypothetical protein n=1 Tax=Streptomyces sp. 8K308 TaxID=2530388 RepID=UPI00104B152A|nr:hypothetical protein [Streptomyces sp. 8K308]TDC27142.1 hypothetical protein E1265_02365 [Streptomyces sp. 8K308]